MYTLKIKITKEILEKSKNCQDKDLERNCAISLAIRDVFPYASTDNSSICPFSDDLEISLPKKAVSFIDEFDLSSPQERVLMPEIEFSIRVKNKVIERINIDEIKPLLQNHHCLTLINS